MSAELTINSANIKEETNSLEIFIPRTQREKLLRDCGETSVALGERKLKFPAVPKNKIPLSTITFITQEPYDY